ncbi:MAG: hypothetical protein JSS72_04955 [Armatimonadetes bacterium]|nr:hypothetical protein [Armatimonadota bacterium]
MNAATTSEPSFKPDIRTIFGIWALCSAVGAVPLLLNLALFTVLHFGDWYLRTFGYMQLAFLYIAYNVGILIFTRYPSCVSVKPEALALTNWRKKERLIPYSDIARVALRWTAFGRALVVFLKDGKKVSLGRLAGERDFLHRLEGRIAIEIPPGLDKYDLH